MRRRDLFWDSLRQPRFDPSEVCIRWVLVRKQLELVVKTAVGEIPLIALNHALNISRNAEQELAQVPSICPN